MELTREEKRELNEILRQHAARYPRMEPCDAVKLIFQNEFGGEHLIVDAESSLAWIRREFSAVGHDDREVLHEPIGNGAVRVHLAALREEDLEKFNEDFIRAARAHGGSRERLEAKLALLYEQCEAVGFSFSANELAAFLKSYRDRGFPVISHSEAFRTAYRPAYRVMRVKF